MMDQIIKAIVPIAVTVIISVLTAVIKAVGKTIVKYVEKKQEAIAFHICMEKYNCELEFARSAWGMVEEYFRITPCVQKTSEAKQEIFDKIIKQKFPELKDSEIIELRQTIAGEMNKLKM